MRCPECGDEHGELEPAFGLPDDVFVLPADERAERLHGNQDLVILSGATESDERFFVRCVLPVRLVDVGGETRWGVWAEVDEADARRIFDLWDEPDQAGEPPIAARIANALPGYPDTIGLPVQLQLTGPTSRPALTFPSDSIHPFAREARAGVRLHRLAEWLSHLR